MKRHLVLVVALVVLSSGVVAGSSYELTAENAIDTPDRSVEVAGMSYEINEIAQFDSGEEITVTVTGPEDASVQLRDEEGSIVDFKRLPEDGTQQVSFSSEGLTPGIYGIALNVDGSFEEVLPVVISGYDLTVTTPDAATTNDTVTVSVDLAYEALTNPPDAVRIAVWTGDFLSDATAEKISDQTYEADFDLENAPTGEFQTYAVAISDERVNGYPNPLAVGTDSTLTVTEADDEDSTNQSGDDGDTNGDDSSDSDDGQEGTDSDGDGTESGSDETGDDTESGSNETGDEETNDQTGDEETDSDGTEDGETDSGGDDGTDGDQTDDGQSGDEQGTDDGETDDGTNQEDSNDEDDGSSQDDSDDGTTDDGNSDSDEEGDTDNETTDGMNDNEGSGQDGDSDGADENDDGTDQDGDNEGAEQTSSNADDAIEPDDGGADTEENVDDSGPGFSVILVAAVLLVLASLLTIGLLLRVRD